MTLNGIELPSLWGKLWVHKLAEASDKQSNTPLICLHPAPFDGNYFADFAQCFNGQHNIWAPDYPGYGRSDSSPQAPSIDDYARALLHASDEQLPGEPDHPLHLLGFHTGCLVACEMALQAPERVGGLILIDVPYFTGREQQEKYRENYDGSPQSQGFGATFSYPCAEKLPQVETRTLMIASGSTLNGPTHQAANALANVQLENLPEIGRPVFKTGGKQIADLVGRFLSG